MTLIGGSESVTEPRGSALERSSEFSRNSTEIAHKVKGEVNLNMIDVEPS